MPDFSMIVDVVDQQNRPVSTAVRGDLFAERRNFRTVHVLLRDRSARFILQKLPENHPRSPGRLGSSAAGYLKAGESYTQAAERKLQSEIGVNTPLKCEGDFVMIDETSKKFVGVFSGYSDITPAFDPSEIATLIYLRADDICSLMLFSPEKFTHTFQCLYEAKKHIFA